MKIFTLYVYTCLCVYKKKIMLKFNRASFELLIRHRRLTDYQIAIIDKKLDDRIYRLIELFQYTSY